MVKQSMKVCLLSLVFAFGAQAAEVKKDAAVNGAAEGGFGFSSSNGSKNSQWMVDQAAMKMRYEASEHTSFVFDNVFSFNSSLLGATVGQNGQSFNSKYALSNRAADGSTFQLANQNAYVEHKNAGIAVAVGHMRTPFGYESTMTRYNMGTYYYSQGFATAQGYGWNYDLGVKATLTDYVPGKLEVAVIDGRNMFINQGTGIGEALTPAGVARYSYEYNGGDWTLTPLASTYLGRWHGSPQDVGITAGANFKMGTVWANAEWVYTSQNTAFTGTANKLWNVYVEPGVDLGIAEISAKWEYVNKNFGGNSLNDMNIGVSLGKTYADKLRIRAVFQQTNLSKKIQPNSSSDFRILVGTSW